MPCMIPSVVWAHLSYFSSSSIDHRTLRSQFIKNWILYLSWMFLCLEKKHGTVLVLFVFFFFLWKVTFCHLILPGQHSSVNYYTILELHNWTYKKKFQLKKCLLWKLQNNSHLPPCNPSCCPSFKAQFSSHDVVELILKCVSLITAIALTWLGAVLAMPGRFSHPCPCRSPLHTQLLVSTQGFPAWLPRLSSPATARHPQQLTLKTELWNEKFGSTRWSSLLMNEIIVMRI